MLSVTGATYLLLVSSVTNHISRNMKRQVFFHLSGSSCFNEHKTNCTPDMEVSNSSQYSSTNKTINIFYLLRSSADNNNKFRPYPVLHQRPVKARQTWPTRI